MLTRTIESSTWPNATRIKNNPMSEPHDVVKLLLARMESHPEEFKNSRDRWDMVLGEVLVHANDAEIAAIHASLRNIRLGEAHEDMMEELCNGPERRRIENEEAEYERKIISGAKK